MDQTFILNAILLLAMPAVAAMRLPIAFSTVLPAFWVTCWMFSFAFIFRLIDGADGFSLLVSETPKHLSRMVIFSIILISLISLIRNNSLPFFVKHIRKFLALSAVLLLAVLVDFTYLSVGVNSLLLMYSTLFAGVLLAVATALAFQQDRERFLGVVRLWAIACLVIVVAVGAVEVNLGLGEILNHYRGNNEYRAVSVFNNPNFFAFALTPFFFFSTILYNMGWRSSAIMIGTIAAFGFLLSGSRSVFIILFLAFIFLLFGLRHAKVYTWMKAIKLLGHQLLVQILGCILGLFLAAPFGTDAVMRIYFLIERLYLWPYYMMTDSDTLISINGRLFQTESGIIDNAFLHAYYTMPAYFSILILGMLISLFYIERQTRLRPSFNQQIAFAACVFFSLSGIIAQTYWAFPLWIMVFCFLGVGWSVLVESKAGWTDRARIATID